MEWIKTLFLLCSLVFFITTTSGQGIVCFRPQLSANIDADGLQRFYNPGAEIVLSCKQGYTPVSGPRVIVCAASGEWTKTKLLCIPKRCPYPGSLTNGELYYDDTVYKSTVNYTCNEGYIMNGADSAECLANGTWSREIPECKSVTCGLAPIPKHGMAVYDTKIRGNNTVYGDQVTYRCHPPYALIGDPRAECTSSGTWTKTPKCEVVTCPPPETIDRGYMSSNDPRQYDYTETVRYGCHGDYVIEGNHQIVCQADGKWSEKPSCKAPCQIGISRGRILYKGQKMWIEDFSPNKVLHKEIVSVYCLDKTRNCGYAVSTQCIDGNLNIPSCFEEPGRAAYTFKSGNLPSEITQC